MTPAPDPKAHQPGEPHRYAITCRDCGQSGTVRLTVEPERDPIPELVSPAPTPDLDIELLAQAIANLGFHDGRYAGPRFRAGLIVAEYRRLAAEQPT